MRVQFCVVYCFLYYNVKLWKVVAIEHAISKRLSRGAFSAPAAPAGLPELRLHP